MNFTNPIYATCSARADRELPGEFKVSSGQTAVECLAAHLKETPQELRSKMKSIASRMASEMRPPGQLVDEQKFDRGVETIALGVLDLCRSAQPDPQRPTKVVANLFYSQARDLVSPPRRETHVTQEALANLKQIYAEAQRADRDNEVVLAEGVQELFGKIRK
jgi:hypothetical protein